MPARASSSNGSRVAPVVSLPAAVQADLRRRVSALKRVYTKNAQARIRHAEDPKKWALSEVALHDAIVALSAIAASPQQYRAFIQLEGLDNMLHLIQHPNVDIVAVTLRTMAELCDTEGESDIEPYIALHGALVKVGAFDAAIEALVHHTTVESLRENDEGAHAVLHSGLDIFDHAAEMRHDNLEFAAKAIARLQTLLDSFVSAAESGEESGDKKRSKGPSDGSDSISGAVARVVETLALLLHDTGNTRSAFVEAGGIRTLISAAVMHAHEKGAESQEAALNALSVLCDVLLGGALAKEEFVKAGGIESTIHLIRISPLRSSAIKLLDFACMACQAAVSRAFDSGAVGMVFAAFGKLPSAEKMKDRTDVEHVLGAMFSMLRYASNEQERNRMLYKFWQDATKTRKLFSIYKQFVNRIQSIDEGHGKFLNVGSGMSSLREIGDPEEMDRAYLERLDAGLFIVQLAGVIITHLLAYSTEEDLAKSGVREEIRKHGLRVQGILNSVREYADSIEAADGTDEALKNRKEEQDRLRKVVREAQARSLH